MTAVTKMSGPQGVGAAFTRTMGPKIMENEPEIVRGGMIQQKNRNLGVTKSLGISIDKAGNQIGGKAPLGGLASKPFGMGMNGEPPALAKPFGMGMNGEPPALGTSNLARPNYGGAETTTSSLLPTPNIPQTANPEFSGPPTPAPAGPTLTDYIQEAVPSVRGSGIGDRSITGGIRTRGKRGARRGDTIRGGRYNGQRLTDALPKVESDYAAFRR